MITVFTVGTALGVEEHRIKRVCTNEDAEETAAQIAIWFSHTRSKPPKRVFVHWNAVALEFLTQSSFPWVEKKQQYKKILYDLNKSQEAAFIPAMCPVNTLVVELCESLGLPELSVSLDLGKTWNTYSITKWPNAIIVKEEQ